MMHPAPRGVDVFALLATTVAGGTSPAVDFFSLDSAKAHFVLLLIIPCEIITRELCVAAQIHHGPFQGIPPIAAIVIHIFFLIRNGLKINLQNKRGYYD